MFVPGRSLPAPRVLRSPSLSPPPSTPSSSSAPPFIRSKRHALSSIHLKGDVPSLHAVPLEDVQVDPFEFSESESGDESFSPVESSSSSESDEEEEEEKKQDKGDSWSKDPHDIIPPSFDLAASPSREAKNCETPLEFFELFVTSDLIDVMVEATNGKGAIEYGESWTHTTGNEIKTLIAAVIFMGMYRHPDLKSYWSHDARAPFISAIFPNRDRFLHLYRAFYINPTKKNPHDPLWHVRPLLDALSYSFPTHYSPSRVLVVDESMVPCKARSFLKQYIKSKHHRWGFKIWCLVSDGYLLRFSVYTGKKSQNSLGAPRQVVEHLVEPYYGRNHLVVMNNFYSSLSLLRSLLSHSTFALGTIRPNRVGFPKDLARETENFKNGQTGHRQIGQLVVYSFNDRKPVYFLSSFHPPSAQSFLFRHAPSGWILVLPVPTAIEDYNLLRGQVDTLDQRLSYCSLPRQSRRWWPHLAWWLLDVAIANAQRLFEIKSSEKISAMDFRTQLMHQLVGDIPSQAATQQHKRPRLQPPPSEAHQLVPSLTLHDCVICSRRPEHRKRTNFQCAPCGVYVCASPCYDIHRAVNH